MTSICEGFVVRWKKPSSAPTHTLIISFVLFGLNCQLIVSHSSGDCGILMSNSRHHLMASTKLSKALYAASSEDPTM